VSSRVIVAIRVAATRARAFDVFTREIDLWWQPSPLFALTPGTPGRLTFERRLGGRLVEAREDGSSFEIGRIVEWTPGEVLVFTWRQSTFPDDRTTEVSVRFDAVGDETRVTVEHRGWDGIPQEHVARHGFPNAIFLQRHGEWWQTLLGGVGRRIRDAGV